MGEQLAAPVLGAVAGSIFGGNKKTNPYAPQLEGVASDLSGVRQNWRDYTNSATSGYQQFDPQYRKSVNSYKDYLQQDPFTDQYSARVLGQATQGTNAAYSAAKANLAADMARRGITGSSVDNGTLGSIETARAADISGAQNNLALAKVNSQDARLRALVGLLGNTTSGYRDAATQGLGAQSGIDSGIASIYGNLNSSANQVAEQENDATNAGIAGLAGGVGQLVSSARGSGPTLQQILQQIYASNQGSKFPYMP